MAWSKKAVRICSSFGHYSGPDDDSGIKPCQFTVWIRLDSVKRDILVFLGVSFFFDSIKKSAIGLQDVMDTVTEGSDKSATITLKLHVTDIQAILNLGQFIKSNTVACKIVLAVNMSPYQMTRRYG